MHEKTPPVHRLMKTSFLWCAFIATLCFSGCGGEKVEMEKIIMWHMQRYPQMEVEDLYKLVYQSAMGISHFISNPEKAREYLNWEMSHLKDGEDIDLSEPLSPDGVMIRVNLYKYKQGGGEADDLFEAMMKSAENHQPSIEKIEKYWDYLADMAESGKLPFTPSELESFFEEMGAMNFPAVHHSETYRELYHPAYRVILSEYLPRSIK